MIVKLALKCKYETTKDYRSVDCSQNIPGIKWTDIVVMSFVSCLVRLYPLLCFLCFVLMCAYKKKWYRDPTKQSIAW